MSTKPKIIDIPVVELFAVRSKDGKWFRRKGFGGSGSSWVDDFHQARIYNKPGPARSQITFFANNWPQFGVPDLVKISINKVELVEESDRVNKVKKKKLIADGKAKERSLIELTERTKKDLEHAKEVLKRLNEL